MENEIYNLSKKYLEDVESILPELDKEILLKFTRYISQGRNKNTTPVIIFSEGVISANFKSSELFGISHILFSSWGWDYVPDYSTNEITLSILEEVGNLIFSYSDIPSTEKLIRLRMNYIRELLIKLFSGTTMTKEEFLRIVDKPRIFNFPINNFSSLDEGIKFHHVIEIEGVDVGEEFDIKFELLKDKESKYVRFSNSNSILLAKKLIELYEKK